MSCSTNSQRAGSAGPASGISRLSSRSNYTAARLAATRALDWLGQTAAPFTVMAHNAVNPTDPATVRIQATLKRSAGQLIRGACLLAALADQGLGIGQIMPVLGKVRLVAKGLELATGAAGTGLAALSKTKEAGQVLHEKRKFLLFKSKRPVSLWQFSLTRLINKREMIGLRQVTKNSGVMFKIGGKSWHQGTVSFEVNGRVRTINHLQSLSLPAAHYYFDRPLSRRQTVALAAGRVKPETLPGFAGQIKAGEYVAPAWVAAKRSLILARLYWPPT